MSETSAFVARMKRELQMLANDPPFGIAAWPVDNKINLISAQIVGPTGTVYQNGTFDVQVDVPLRYPFEPPKVRFLTKIYHPNIGQEGRICLDTLNMPPKGGWTPSLNLSSVLTMVRQLLCTPNADDGLEHEITRQYKFDRHGFDKTARQWTAKYACDNHSNTTTSTTSVSSSTSLPAPVTVDDVKIPVVASTSSPVVVASVVDEDDSDDEPSDDEPEDPEHTVSHKKQRLK